MSLALILASTGCLPKAPGPVDINRCAVEKTADGQYKPMLAPELVETGNEYLEGALHDLPQVDPGDVQKELQRSDDCFGRALRLAPDNYDAQLSMGITYLAHARLLHDDSPERSSLLKGARHMLGRAYMLRHGAYEPLYYLAEVAIAEGDLVTARHFLEPLRAAGTKAGPVNMLLGYLSEREGKTDEAQEFYRKAVTAGWPAETLQYATTRLDQLRGWWSDPRKGG
jgi:hypothetical protein